MRTAIEVVEPRTVHPSVMEWEVELGHESGDFLDAQSCLPSIHSLDKKEEDVELKDKTKPLKTSTRDIDKILKGDGESKDDEGGHTTRGAIDRHLVSQWLARWDESDPRREVFGHFGVIVRQRCIARILVEACRSAQETGWRNNTAFPLMASLLRDMPFEMASNLLREWNEGLARPLDEAELEGIIRYAEANLAAPRPECDHAVLGQWCSAPDECDWYLQNRAPGGARPRGMSAVIEHGRPEQMKPRELATYEALCVLEEVKPVRAGGTVPATYRSLHDIAGVDKNGARPALERLQALRYITVDEWGDPKKFTAAIVRRLFPLPLYLNGGLTPQNIGCAQDASRTTAAGRSDILEHFIKHYTEPVSGEALDYLRGRGFNIETVELARLRLYTPECGKRANAEFPSAFTHAQFKAAGLALKFFAVLHTHRLVIPYYEDGRIVTLKGRSLDPSVPAKERYCNIKCPMPLAYRTSRTLGTDVVVCEGEMDALSAFQLGFNAIGLTTANRMPPALAGELSGHRVVLALDADEAGRTGTYSAEGRLRKAGVQYARAAVPQGDLNDAMQADPTAARALLMDAFTAMPEPIDAATYSDSTTPQKPLTYNRFASYN